MRLPYIQSSGFQQERKSGYNCFFAKALPTSSRVFRIFSIVTTLYIFWATSNCLDNEILLPGYTKVYWITGENTGNPENIKPQEIGLIHSFASRYFHPNPCPEYW